MARGPRPRRQSAQGQGDRLIAARLSRLPWTTFARLHHLYVVLANDKRVRTPLDNVEVPRPEKRRPTFVDARTILRVEQAVRAGDPQTRAGSW